MSDEQVALRPAAFLRSERRTPPRLLPLWGIGLIALLGYQPGSHVWALTALASLLIGVMVAPLVGSISPTVVAYVSLLAVVGGLLAFSWWLPVGTWYNAAWADPSSTGLVVMMLLGAVAVAGLSSLVWAVFVSVEALRRIARRPRLDATSGRQGAQEVNVRIAPAVPLAPQRTRGTLPRRAYIGILCLTLAVPLPSFFITSGVFIRPLVRPHEGLGGLVSDVFTATVWPSLTVVWLAVGAVVGWLVWHRAPGRARVIAIAVGAALVSFVVLAASTFALVPTGAGAQGFAPWVLDYCVLDSVSGESACAPPWLFSAPRLAEITASVAPWLVLLLVAGTAALGAIAYRASRPGETGAAPRA